MYDGGGDLTEDDLQAMLEPPTPAGAFEVPRFEFSKELQQQIVASSMRDTEFLRRTDGILEPSHFESATDGVMISIVQEYFKGYKKAPSTPTLIELLKDKKQKNLIPKDIWDSIKKELPAYMKADISDSDFLVTRVADFARNQAVEAALLKSIDLKKKGEFGKIEAELRKALAVGANDKFEGIDYWDDIDARSSDRKEIADGKRPPSGITTGIAALDRKLYHQGWGIEELAVMMGAAKKGKSTFLGHFAKGANMAGHNVLYITLEVASRIIADRTDANVANHSMEALNADWEEVRRKLLEQRAGSGIFKIHEYPPDTFTPADLTRLLHNYKHKHGIKFDLVVIDYLDIMAPDHRSREPREDSKQVWLGCRRIAKEEKIALLTATQTNRDGAKNSVAGDTDVADDYNKIRIADLVISINRTEEEERTGFARLHFAASRNQKGKITIRVRQDLDKMNPVKEIVDIS